MLVDTAKRDALLDSLRALGLEMAREESYYLQYGDRGFALPIERFFDGLSPSLYSTAFASNLIDHPAEATADWLTALRSTAGIEEVLIGIASVEPDVHDWWLYSDHLYVIATATAEDVLNAFDDARAPDEITLLAAPEYPYGVEDQTGMNVFLLYWD